MSAFGILQSRNATPLSIRGADSPSQADTGEAQLEDTPIGAGRHTQLPTSQYTSLSDNNWTPVGREKYEELKDKVERFVQSSTAEPWDKPNFLREFSKLKAEIAECKDGAVKVGSLPLSNQMDELVLQLDNFFCMKKCTTLKLEPFLLFRIPRFFCSIVFTSFLLDYFSG